MPGRSGVLHGEDEGREARARGGPQRVVPRDHLRQRRADALVRGHEHPSESRGAEVRVAEAFAEAREIIRAAKRGFKGPVSVKTRLGYNADQLQEWLPELLAEAPAAITIHARTRKEMSLVPARWERIKRAVEIRNTCQGDALTQTLILGNGDVKDIADAKEKIRMSGADGAMLGRAIYVPARRSLK